MQKQSTCHADCAVSRAQDLLVMHFQEGERQGELGATLGDMEVTGVKQHELVDWYFAHQSER